MQTLPQLGTGQHRSQTSYENPIDREDGTIWGLLLNCASSQGLEPHA